MKHKLHYLLKIISQPFIIGHHNCGNGLCWKSVFAFLGWIYVVTIILLGREMQKNLQVGNNSYQVNPTLSKSYHFIMFVGLFSYIYIADLARDILTRAWKLMCNLVVNPDCAHNLHCGTSCGSHP